MTIPAKRFIKQVLLLASLAASLWTPLALAGACTSTATNVSWLAGSTWTAGCTGVGGIPAGGPGGDNVTIASGHNIKIDAPGAVARSLIIAGGAASNGFVALGGNNLTINNDFTFTGPTAAAASSTVDFGTGILTVGGGTTINSGAGLSVLSIGTGTFNGSNVTFGGTAANARFLANTGSTANITGNFASGGTLTVTAPQTFNFIGAAAQTIGAYLTYSNVVVNNTSAAAVSFAGATQVNGALTVTKGNLVSNAGAKLFVGAVTVSALGSFTNPGNVAINYRGGITNNGTFNAGTGAQTFDTNNQTLAGGSAITFGGAVVLAATAFGGVTVTNNNTAAVNIAVDLQGPAAGGVTWVQGANSTLNIGGTLLNLATGTLNAAAVGNTVNYNGATARTVKLQLAASYYNLTLSTPGAAKIMTIGSAAGQTLTVLGNFSNGASVTYDGTANNPAVNITGNADNSGSLKTGTGTYVVGGNLTNNATGTFALSSGSFTVNGNLTNSALAPNSFATNAGPFNLKGNFTNNGTFISGAGLFTFNGAAAQTFSGTAGATTTINLVALNNLAGLTLTNGHNLTVGTGVPAVAGCATPAVPAVVLTLTQGQITTGSSTLFIANGSTIAGAGVTTGGVTSFIAGNLRKPFPPGGSITRVFEVGTGNSYAPLSLSLACATAAASLTVFTTAGNHPQAGTSTINLSKHVKRYWTMTVVAASASWFSNSALNQMVFNFVNSDIDAGAVTSNFFVWNYVAATWTAPIAPSTAAANSTTISGASVVPASVGGDYEVGEVTPVNPPPSAFNAFESTTAAGAVIGKIYTKLAGTAFSLDVVAILAGAQQVAFTNNVSVSLVANTTGAALAANNCPVASTVIQGPATVAIVGGRSTVNFGAVAGAYRDVRVLVQYPTVAPTVIACSADDFSIRPTAFTVSSVAVNPGDTVATNTSSSGAPAIKTGAFFDLSAASIAGYDGAPTLDNNQVIGSPAAGTIGGVFGAAPVGTGIATGTTFFYSEVGNFGLGVNAVYEKGFTSVDQPGDCTPDYSNTLVNGMYGCWFGSGAVPAGGGSNGFGRFIPDNFLLTVATPGQFGTLCGNFTYVGQPFKYVIKPVITVTARNGTNNGLLNATTTNYAGSYTNIATMVILPATQAARYSRFDALGGGATPPLDTSGLPLPAADPAISAFVAGIGQLTFDTNNGLNFTRGLPALPYAADIALSLTSVTDQDGVTSNAISDGSATAGNGIAFNPPGGKNNFYYGRMRVANANGSELLPLQVGLQTQYYVSTGGGNGTFTVNTSDSCTPILPANIGRGNFLGNLTAAQATPTITTGPTFVSGVATLNLSAPGAGKNGAMDVVANLENAAGSVTCIGLTAGTGANLTFLHDVQSCSTPNYTQDPTAHITFGVYNLNPKSIYMRENY